MPTIFCDDSDLAAWWGGMGKILGFVREKNEEFEREGEEVGVIEDTLESRLDGEPWLLVDKSPSPSPASPTARLSNKPPRARLCAAHTTFGLDAENAVLEMKSFMAAILRDEVPSKIAKQGSSGEERWLWDYALGNAMAGESETKGKYSVLAPLRLIEKGRRTIPKEQWNV